MDWFVGALLSLLVTTCSYYLSFLTKGGAIAVYVVGWLIFSLGKMTFSLPILIFFISSNIFSRLGKSQKSQLKNYYPQKNTRDVGQIMANGIFPILFLLGWSHFHHPMWILLFFSSLAGAAADTWATEIGVLSKQNPRSLLNFRTVQKGISGGVSVLGEIAAILGAFLIAAVGICITRLETKIIFSWKHLVLVTFAGFVSQIFDSILGAALQVKYQCSECHQITERKTHCKSALTEKISGIRWVNNDLVNFLSIGCGIGTAWLTLKTIN
ncbi:MAG: DUF92 domain-containing protein [bacterium]